MVLHKTKVLMQRVGRKKVDFPRGKCVLHSHPLTRAAEICLSSSGDHILKSQQFQQLLEKIRAGRLFGKRRNNIKMAIC